MKPTLRTLTALVLSLVMTVVDGAASVARADDGIPVVRDAEAEQLITEYMRPILRAAGLGSAGISVIIVADDSFNAFVADSRHIFVNAGTIMDTDTPNELIGVLAHETGHMKANHLAQLRDQLQRSQVIAIIGMLAGGAAAALSRNGQAGTAAALAGAQIAQRTLLAYARSDETAADRAALTYLEKAHESAKGMLTTFENLEKDSAITMRGADPYLQTHPMFPERIAQIETVAKQSPYFNTPDPPALVLRHQLMRAKFIGYMRNQRDVLRAFPLSDKSLPARYARAVFASRFADRDAALKSIDGLIASQPGNPYFHELKAQVLSNSGKIDQAIVEQRRAVGLAPGVALLSSGLGQLMVQSGDAKLTAQAIPILEKAVKDDRDDGLAWQQLAIAYARKGDIAMADLATAETLFAQGNIFDAQVKANQAKKALKYGSPAWLRADDIASYKPPVR